jgi:DNA-binding LacI/PurR family transcriptional regulator
MPLPSRQASTKFQMLCDEILRLAQTLGSDAKLPTVAQLCAEYSVTVVTLNSALEEMERRGVIYRRRGAGIYVDPAMHQKSIVLLCHPSFFQSGTPPFWNMLVERVTQQAESRQEKISMHFTAWGYKDEMPIDDSLLQKIRDQRVHGILGVGLTNAQTHWIEALGVPYVGFAGAGRCHIENDFIELVRLGVEQLALRGCRSIGMWLATPVYRPRKAIDYFPEQMRQTLKGFLQDHQLPYYPELVQDNLHLQPEEDSITTMSSYEQGFHTAMRVFCKPTDRKPDGVVIFPDNLTRGALVALNKLGVEAGKDFLIATQSNVNSSVLLGFEEQVIALEYDPNQIVSTMFEMLEALMRGETPEPCIAVLKPHYKETRV